MTRHTAVAALLLALTIPFVFHTARAQEAPAADDLNTALLKEVRGLRAALEQLASAGPRIQLAMGRLQLQEQRLNTLVRRVDGLRDQITSKESERSETQERLTRFEAVSSTEHEPEKRRDIEEQVRMVKVALARMQTEIQRLRADEADASNALTQEQGRWAEINARLEVLDRSLGKATR